VQSALKELEVFSLRSSEEINENIEQLLDCIENNAKALERAIKDMQNMQQK
jgi:methyl-accepting chemotaxis protein